MLNINLIDRFSLLGQNFGSFVVRLHQQLLQRRALLARKGGPIYSLQYNCDPGQVLHPAFTRHPCYDERVRHLCPRQSNPLLGVGNWVRSKSPTHTLLLLLSLSKTTTNIFVTTIPSTESRHFITTPLYKHRYATLNTTCKNTLKDTNTTGINQNKKQIQNKNNEQTIPKRIPNQHQIHIHPHIQEPA